MTVHFGALGKRAAQFHLGGMRLTTAAEYVLTEALEGSEVSYPQLLTMVKELSKRPGFSLYYLPVENEYRTLIGFTMHHLRDDDIWNTRRCTLLMVRIEAMRWLAKGGLRAISGPTPAQLASIDAVDHLSLREVALRCLTDPERARERLETYIETGDLAYPAVYAEIRGRYQHYMGIAFDVVDGITIRLGDVILGCRPDNTALMLQIATCVVVAMYHPVMLDFNNDQSFSGKLPQPTRLDLRRGFWRQR